MSWSDSQIDMVTDFKFLTKSSQINISLLPILHGFQMLLYLGNFMFHFLDHFWSKYFSIHLAIPIHRRYSFPSLQHFKWAHVQRFLLPFVILELCQVKLSLPTSCLIHHVHVQLIFQHLIHSFNLSIHLRVISYAKIQLHYQFFEYYFPKV